MKKFLALFCVMAVLCGIAAGCGGNNGKAKDTGTAAVSGSEKTTAGTAAPDTTAERSDTTAVPSDSETGTASAEVTENETTEGKETTGEGETTKGKETTGEGETTKEKETAGTPDTEKDDPAPSVPDSEIEVKLSTKMRKLYNTDYSGYGLQLNEDGTILLNGKPFYGMGVNYFPAFILSMDKLFSNDRHTDLEAHFKALSEMEVPYIRVCFNLFYGNQMHYYYSASTHDKYMAAMDTIVMLAEKYDIGIIASLFWNHSSIVEFAGETYDAMGNPGSKTIAYCQEYITEVVGRYKYSPAIWAWEIGNELNLAVDIPNTQYVGDNGKPRLFKTDLLTSYYTLLGEMIRDEDPYRMITGGDSAPRDSSMSLYKSGQWSPKNTYEDLVTTFGWYTPDPLDTVSIHYPSADYIEDYVKAAKQLKLGLYVGEYYADGYMYDGNYGDRKTAAEDPKEALEQEKWKEMTYKLRDLGYQMYTAWCYGTYSQGRQCDYMSLELGVLDGVVNNYYQHDIIKEINAQYKKDGRQASESYWAAAENALLR